MLRKNETTRLLVLLLALCSAVSCAHASSEPGESEKSDELRRIQYCLRRARISDSRSRIAMERIQAELATKSEKTIPDSKVYDYTPTESVDAAHLTQEVIGFAKRAQASSIEAQRIANRVLPHCNKGKTHEPNLGALEKLYAEHKLVQCTELGALFAEQSAQLAEIASDQIICFTDLKSKRQRNRSSSHFWQQ